MSVSLIVNIKKEAVINQYPDMLIKAKYYETDEFEDGLEYGTDTIRKEPPLNRAFDTFEGGVTITYLGSDSWKLEASLGNEKYLAKALKKITPVADKVV